MSRARSSRCFSPSWQRLHSVWNGPAQNFSTSPRCGSTWSHTSLDLWPSMRAHMRTCRDHGPRSSDAAVAIAQSCTRRGSLFPVSPLITRPLQVLTLEDRNTRTEAAKPRRQRLEPTQASPPGCRQQKAAHPRGMAASECISVISEGEAALNAIRPTPSCQLISPKRQSSVLYIKFLLLPFFFIAMQEDQRGSSQGLA